MTGRRYPAGPGAGYDPDARLAALETRVSGIERGMSALDDKISSRFKETTDQLGQLTAKLDERSKTHWPTIWGAMSVVLGLVIAGGTLAFSPRDESIRRIEAGLNDVAASRVSFSAFSEFKGTYENNRLLFRQDIDARFIRLDGEIGALERRIREGETAVAPRGEQQERWRAQDAAVAALQRQLDDVKSALGGIYGARDVIIDLRERLDRLERGRSAPPG